MRNKKDIITKDVVENGFIYYNLTDVENILDIVNSVKMLGINKEIEINDDIDYLIIMREIFKCLINGDKFNNCSVMNIIEDFRYYEPDILKELQDFDNTLKLIGDYHGEFVKDNIIKELEKEKDYLKVFNYRTIFNNKYQYADLLVKVLEDKYYM